MNQRIQKLRQQSLDAVETISAERAQLLTDFYRSGEAERVSVPVARARAFRYLLEHKELCVNEGELIVGERGPEPAAVPTYPEVCLHSLQDLEILDTRDKIPYRVDAEVRKVYEVTMTVKLPTGLREAELARPVIEVKNFLTGNLEFEIYTFGEQTIVVPVKGVGISGLEQRLRRILSNVVPTADIRIEGSQVNIIVPREDLRSIKKVRRKLRKIENEYGITINLRLV